MIKELVFREQVDYLEKAIGNIPGALHGDCFPLEHYFSNGMYMRQITVPKGVFLIGKIHKMDHPSFMLKGEVSVITKEGVKRLKAPLMLITKAGDKRAGYIHEEMVWVDVFKTDETNLEKVEDECIIKEYPVITEGEEFLIPDNVRISFRGLTERVIAAEKPGFWSDWTIGQQELFVKDDWEAFSRSRGYSELEISECKEWKRLIKANPKLLFFVRDIILAAAIKNIILDTKGENSKSSRSIL